MRLCGNLEAALVKASWVESLVGNFTWFFLLARGALSVFDVLYDWLGQRRATTTAKQRDPEQERGPRPRKEAEMQEKLSNTVRKEIEIARRLLPFIVCDLAAEWDEKVQMADASEEGGAVIMTVATLQEVKEEARWSPRGGWTIFTGRPEELERRGL